MLPLALALAVGMGIVLGLLGGGGSILTVPILVYALGFSPKEAIATSLLVVGLTALSGVYQHARAGNVRWGAGLTFGAFSMAGSYAGGRLAGVFRGEVLLLLFAGLMVVTAVAMLRRGARRELAARVEERPAAHRLLRIGAQGLAVGAVTGLVGAGGGFLVVPALVLLGGVPMKEAIGTSLLVIGLNSSAALAGHLSHERIDWLLALAITAASVLGTVGGAALARRLDAARLRKGFAFFVLAMAAWMIYDNLPHEWLVRLHLAGPAVLWASALLLLGGTAVLLLHAGGRPTPSASSEDS